MHQRFDCNLVFLGEAGVTELGDANRLSPGRSYLDKGVEVLPRAFTSQMLLIEYSRKVVYIAT